MQKIEGLTAAVVAGGNSSRFGEPKELVKIGNRPLIQYACGIAGRLSAEHMVISNNGSLKCEVMVYSDIIPNCGPLGGIYTALFHAKTDFVAIIPCDMPFLRAEVYRILFSRVVIDNAVVAVSEKGLEPLVSIWPSDSVPILYKNILEKKLSLRKTLSEISSEEVYIPDQMPDYSPEIFMNINFKDDLRTAKTFGRIMPDSII